MTPEKLSEVNYINKEIACIQQEIAELKETNFYRPNNITGMPKGGERRDEFVEYAEEMRTLESMLYYSLKKLQMKRQEIESFFQTIEDPELRLIMRMRTVNNMKWEEIGRELGMERTTVSKKFYKFFSTT